MTFKKGIILAGGNGTRLHPITISSSKQMLPVYDKPMIYYSLSTLIKCGIEQILLISSGEHITSFKKLLGDGSMYGIDIKYKAQNQPNGIAEAFLIAEDFIGLDNVALILGDNIFYFNDEDGLIRKTKNNSGATLIATHVENPSRFGVLGYDSENYINSIEEKPISPKSNHAVTGLYFYDKNVVEIAKSVDFSERGELEITDVNRMYMERGHLDSYLMQEQDSWFDTGTHDSLLDASIFIMNKQNEISGLIGSPELEAFKKSFITERHFKNRADFFSKTSYGKMLFNFIDS